MTRDEVLRIIKEAREKGDRPNLYGANLYGADLHGADLRGANLSDANLYWADLSMTDLTDRIIQIGPIGSRKDYICYNATLDEMICGCFFGTLADFKESVRKTHGTSKHAREYLAMVRFLEEIMEINR